MTFITGIQTRVGKYELGHTLGEGTFAKVKFAKNLETGDCVAIKVLEKEKILKHKMVQQIKREISIMRLVKHPSIVRLFEVIASKTKVYIVLEFVPGGQLFDKIARQGRLKEEEARKYFQQLINAIDYCHSRGVYHRDLKPQNLLLDGRGNLKISDFGFSALPQQQREDGLLHTMCGTPDYVAPEVINNKGYEGAAADIWSCGVILFVSMAGYLPFHESNLMTMYKKISRAEFTCPSGFSSGARALILRMLDPNPGSRITVPQILETEWFKIGHQRPKAKDLDREAVKLVDVDALVNDSEHLQQEDSRKPVLMNAFELISTSRGLNLSGLFEEEPIQGEKSLIICRRPPPNYKRYRWNYKEFGGCFKSFLKVYLVCGSKCRRREAHLSRLDSLAY